MPPARPSDDAQERLQNLTLELRRGSLPLAVLAALRAEHYGYTLRRVLAERGLEIDEGTLYPLLRRLEAQGLLASSWREEESRPRRYYRLSPDGKAVLQALAAEWRRLGTALEEIL
ncbi:MAG: PadR family transcriptional regulator [Anaeromyxobacter sp.]